MNNYALSVGDSYIVTDEKGNMIVSENSLEVATLKNIIEMLENQIRKNSQNISSINSSGFPFWFLSSALFVVCFFFNLYVFNIKEFYLGKIFTFILTGFFDAVSAGVIIQTIITRIQSKYDKKQLNEELSQKRELLEKYNKELADALEKSKTSVEERKPVYSYEFDRKKALSACEEYVPLGERNFFERKELKRKR